MQIFWEWFDDAWHKENAVFNEILGAYFYHFQNKIFDIIFWNFEQKIHNLEILIPKITIARFPKFHK